MFGFCLREPRPGLMAPQSGVTNRTARLAHAFGPARKHDAAARTAEGEWKVRHAEAPLAQGFANDEHFLTDG